MKQNMFSIFPSMRIFIANPELKKAKNIEAVIRIRGDVTFSTDPTIPDCVIGLQQDAISISWIEQNEKRGAHPCTPKSKNLNYSNFLFSDRSEKLPVCKRKAKNSNQLVQFLALPKKKKISEPQ
jgi:hypothetical protein